MSPVLALWVSLLAAGGDAKLLLTVAPSDAAVAVDGRKVKDFRNGEAIVLKPGAITLSVSASGYETEKRTVRLNAGEATRVNIRLEKKPDKDDKPAVVVGRGKGDKADPKDEKGDGKGDKKGDDKPGRPTVKPVPRGDDPKPTVKPRDGGGAPIGRKPDDDKGGKGGGKKDDDDPFKRKPKDPDDKVGGKGTFKPRDGGGARPKPRADDDKPRPRPKTGDDRRPTRKPRGGGGGAGGGDTYDDRPVRDDGPTDLRPYAALSFVVGGLAITGGIIAGVSADEKADELHRAFTLREKQDLKDQSENRALASNVLYGVGATGVLVGALLWAMSPDENSYATAAPLPGGGAMVGWGGTF